MTETSELLVENFHFSLPKNGTVAGWMLSASYLPKNWAQAFLVLQHETAQCHAPYKDSGTSVHRTKANKVETKIKSFGEKRQQKCLNLHRSCLFELFLFNGAYDLCSSAVS